MATVAYEPDHSGACEDSCSCGGLAGYIAQTKDALRLLGASDPDADVAALKDYVARARQTGLSPSVAANLVYAMRHGFSRGMAQEIAMASDYIAVDSRGRRVWGPGKDYLEAKRHAELAGGVVKFEMGASELSMAADYNSEIHAAVAQHAQYIGREGDHVWLYWRTGSAYTRRRVFFVEGNWHVASRWEQVEKLPRGVQEITPKQRELYAPGAEQIGEARDCDHSGACDCVGIHTHTPVDVSAMAGDTTAEYRRAEASAYTAAATMWTHVPPLYFVGAKIGMDGLPTYTFSNSEKRKLPPYFLIEVQGHATSILRVEAGSFDRHEKRMIYDYPFGFDRPPEGGFRHVSEPAGAQERVSYADRQKLPRSAFAIPERRALLLTDKHGNPDEGHVKAAAARLSMMRREHHVNRNEHAEAHRRIIAAGKRVGIDVAEPYGECPAWYIESEPVYVGRWERGQAETDGAGKAVLARRKPDRRHGVAPWAVHVGEHEVASGETKAEAKRKFERCVRAVKARGEAANPWAVCHAAINKSGAAEVAIVERTSDAAPGGKRCASPEDLHRLFGERYGRMGQEVFEVVLVNINDEMIGSPVQVAMGQASGVAVEVEQVMAVVIAGRAQAATGFFALHNHPGGTLQASPQDRDLTRRIEAARKIACPNVRFLGHIILTAKGWAKA